MLDVPKLLRILNISQKELDHLLDNIDSFYYLISNPKLDKKGIQLIDKNGKPRTRDLYPSLRLMKSVQKRIHVQLLKTIKLPNYAFGGIAKRDNILNAKKYKNVPLWIFHGGLDDVVNPQLSYSVYRELKKLGHEPKYTIYLKANHNSWDSAFAEPDLLPWLFSHHK